MKKLFPKVDASLNERNNVSPLPLLSLAEEHDSWHEKGEEARRKAGKFDEKSRNLFLND